MAPTKMDSSLKAFLSFQKHVHRTYNMCHIRLGKILQLQKPECFGHFEGHFPDNHHHLRWLLSRKRSWWKFERRWITFFKKILPFSLRGKKTHNKFQLRNGGSTIASKTGETSSVKTFLATCSHKPAQNGVGDHWAPLKPQDGPWWSKNVPLKNKCPENHAWVFLLCHNVSNKQQVCFFSNLHNSYHPKKNFISWTQTFRYSWWEVSRSSAPSFGRHFSWKICKV